MLDLEGTLVQRLNLQDNGVLEETISYASAEFSDVGEGPRVAFESDIRGSVVSQFYFEGPGRFFGEPNGATFTFEALGNEGQPSIIDATLIPSLNTINVPDTFVTFTDNSLTVSHAGLDFREGAGWAVQLSYRLDGTNGRDVLLGDAGDDKILGKRAADIIQGGFGNDTISGGSGADVLYGNGGSDVIRGGKGADTLQGGGGNDRLFGQHGADTFVMRSNGQKDDVRDFDVGEDILLIQTGATSLSDMNVVIRTDSIVLRDDGTSLILRDLDLQELADATIVFG